MKAISASALMLQRPALPRRLLAAVLLVLVVLLVLLPQLAVANTAAPLAADPVLERRLMTLAADLRCLVCQNQSLADSNAELAADLRDEIRQRMRGGASDQQVVEYLVARYGDFVLYRPPLKASTLLLWSGPALLFLLGIGMLARTVARRRALPAPPPPSAAARERARELLASNTAEESS